MISTFHDAALLGWLSSSKRNLENPLICTLRRGAVEPRCWVVDWLVADPYMGVLDRPLFGGSVLMNGVAKWLNLPPYMGFGVDLL